MISKIKKKAKEILLWSQKYTKTDMIYLARGGFWLTLGQAISSLSSFLLAIAFANLLPKETYGTYKYILSIASILAIPTLSGIGTAVTQAVARGYEGSLIPALKTKIRWGILGGLASLILAGYYFYQGNTTLTISFLISAVFLPFMDSFGIYDSLLQGRKLFDISTKYFIISQIIAIASLIAVLFFTKNLFLILFAYFASWTLLRFIFLKITLKKFSINHNQDPKTISYGKHLSLIGIIGTIASYLDRILIFHYLGAVEVAVYSFAIAPPNQIKGLFKNLPALALPKLSQRSFKEIDSVLYKRLLKLFIMGGIIAGIYILAAPYIFKIFFPKYLDSIFFSQLFAITIVLTTPISILSAVGQSKLTLTPKSFLYPGSIIPQIILIGSLFLLIKFGIIGVILSRIIFLISAIVVSLIYWKRLFKIYQ
jgi:O-antigen/teichoic acid export membrane protein